jgi:carbonic anhydrase/acetyltransferase-like protein (isoleucine patch superfamily)
MWKGNKMEEERNYEFTGETKTIIHPINGKEVVLHQIQATEDIPSQSLTKGDIGGWIQSYDNLKDNAWVGENAKVFENACVYGNARVYANAYVYGNAHVSEDAWVDGDAWVFGDARVFDNAQIYGKARVFDKAKVFGYAMVCGSADVYGNAEVFENAEVSEDVYVCLKKGKEIKEEPKKSLEVNSYEIKMTKQGIVNIITNDVKNLDKIDNLHYNYIWKEFMVSIDLENGVVTIITINNEEEELIHKIFSGGDFEYIFEKLYNKSIL